MLSGTICVFQLQCTLKPRTGDFFNKFEVLTKDFNQNY